jgi:hypothetical protein
MDREIPSRAAGCSFEAVTVRESGQTGKDDSQRGGSLGGEDSRPSEAKQGAICEIDEAERNGSEKDRPAVCLGAREKKESGIALRVRKRAILAQNRGLEVEEKMQETALFTAYGLVSMA